MRKSLSLLTFFIFYLIHSSQCQDENRHFSPSTYSRRGGVHSNSNNCDTKEVIQKLNDRVGLLASLDESERNKSAEMAKKLDLMDEKTEAVLASISVQQNDVSQRLDVLENIQRQTKHSLDELKGETETIKNLRRRKWKTVYDKNHDLNVNRTARQVNYMSGSNQPDPYQRIENYLSDIKFKVDKIVQSISTLERKTSNLQKRVNNFTRQGGVRQVSVATSFDRPEVPLVTSCQDFPDDQHIVKIQLQQNAEPFFVICEHDPYYNGEWTVILKRFNGVANFHRDWTDYKAGFGNLAGEFFIGLEKLHALTTFAPHELLVLLEDFNNVTRYAKYSHFAIGGERDFYVMYLLGAYEGDAGDSLIYHAGSKFSTYDNDNDGCLDCNCAQSRGGGWWYNWCAKTNPTGNYYKESNYTSSEEVQNGIFWYDFHGYMYSLKKIKMMIRPIADYEDRR